jgi:hypothetical protein
MNTIQCPSISKPTKQFLCEVLRPASQMRYQDPQNGNWKPVQHERSENWKVLAETKEGAKKVAEYHFYASKNITISES